MPPLPESFKREYVKNQGQNRPHHHARDVVAEHVCHWPGCEEQVPPACWGCNPHWFKLPRHLRDRIWLAYRPGQEKDMRPSTEYIALARAIQDWIKVHYPEG